MYEGSDFLLMPSRFEPCGLGQMYAQSQASLPIACRTGGLADTIDDGDTGFLFSTASEFALKRAVGRAFRTYWSGPNFDAMRQNALSKRFDWTGSAKRYRSLYGKPPDGGGAAAGAAVFERILGTKPRRIRFLHAPDWPLGA